MKHESGNRSALFSKFSKNINFYKIMRFLTENYVKTDNDKNFKF